MKIDFATFCHAGDAHRLHAPGQLKRQVESNNFEFDRIMLIYQLCDIDSTIKEFGIRIQYYKIDNIEDVLYHFIDLNRQQYVSSIDKLHQWRFHTVNHLYAIMLAYESQADYIVFADNDCWMVRQPPGESWVNRGIELLQRHDCFIVSPNDGEPERKTRRMSQQMFMARVNDFRYADFNQPDWDGNVEIPGGPMPEYWGMLEGRMELYCRWAGKYRYVLGPEYRYYHHNKLTADDLFETDISKY